MKRYAIFWKESGAKEMRVTPHLKSKGEALWWVLRQRPYLVAMLSEIRIKEWDRNDPK